MGVHESMRDRWWWVLMSVTVLIGYAIFGSMYSFGVFFGELQKEFNSTTVVTGWVQSIALCFSQAFSLPAQMIIPRFGFFNVIVCGTLMCAFGLLLSSFAQSVSFFYVTYGFCFGIASGMATKPNLHLVLEWVPIQYRMRATGIVTLGGNIGILTLTPVLGLIIVDVGWRWTYRICSALIFIICLIIGPLIRITPDKNPENAKTNEQIAMKYKEKESRSKVSQLDVLRFPEMWIFALTLVLVSCAMGFTMVNLVDFVTKSGFTLEQGALVLSLNGGATLFSKIILSAFLDKLRIPTILLWPYGCIIAAVTCIFMTYVTRFETMLTLSIVLGLINGLFNGTSYGVAAELFGHKYSASTASMVAPPSGIGYLMAALVSGFSYDLTGSYDYALYACSGMFLMVAVLSLCTQIWQKTCAVDRYTSMRRTSQAVSMIQRRGTYDAVLSDNSTPILI